MQYPSHRPVSCPGGLTAISPPFSPWISCQFSLETFPRILVDDGQFEFLFLTKIFAYNELFPGLRQLFAARMQGA
jgi:hypothetical protein